MMGAAPSTMKKLRGNILAAVASPGSQACSCTTIRWRLGSCHWDPYIRYTMDQVAMWMDLWKDRKITGLDIDLDKSWHHAVVNLYAKQSEKAKQTKQYEIDWL